MEGEESDNQVDQGGNDGSSRENTNDNTPEVPPLLTPFTSFVISNEAHSTGLDETVDTVPQPTCAALPSRTVLRIPGFEPFRRRRRRRQTLPTIAEEVLTAFTVGPSRRVDTEDDETPPPLPQRGPTVQEESNAPMSTFDDKLREKKDTKLGLLSSSSVPNRYNVFRHLPGVDRIGSPDSFPSASYVQAWTVTLDSPVVSGCIPDAEVLGFEPVLVEDASGILVDISVAPCESQSSNDVTEAVLDAEVEAVDPQEASLLPAGSLQGLAQIPFGTVIDVESESVDGRNSTRRLGGCALRCISKHLLPTVWLRSLVKTVSRKLKTKRRNTNPQPPAPITQVEYPGSQNLVQIEEEISTNLHLDHEPSHLPGQCIVPTELVSPQNSSAGDTMFHPWLETRAQELPNEPISADSLPVEQTSGGSDHAQRLRDLRDRVSALFDDDVSSITGSRTDVSCITCTASNNTYLLETITTIASAEIQSAPDEDEPSEDIARVSLNASDISCANESQHEESEAFADYLTAADVSFTDRYSQGEELGRGSFGKVFVCIEKLKNKNWAVKHIPYRGRMVWNGRDALEDELRTLEKLRSAPYVVYMHDYFMEGTSCFVVMELLPGNCLFGRLQEQGTFTEREARSSCRCILAALQYMHERRIIHRDLKPDNILMASPTSLYPVKVCDFGFSKTLQHRNECRTQCGTPGFMAPEILEIWPAYDVKVDIWSFGVVLFVLLGGYLPFGATHTDGVFERTMRGQYQLYPQRWATISSSAIELVHRCLTVNPKQRISAVDAMFHPWLETREQELPNEPISADSLPVEQTSGGSDHAQRLRDLRDRVSAWQRSSPLFVNDLRSTDAESTALSTFNSAYPEDTIVGRDTHASTMASTEIQSAETSEPVITAGDEEASSFSSQDSSDFDLEFKDVYKLITASRFRLFKFFPASRRSKLDQTFTVKRIDRSRFQPRDIDALNSEIEVLETIKNDNSGTLIALHEIYNDPEITYLVFHRLRGEPLRRRLNRQTKFAEFEARELMRSLLTGVSNCHSKRIAIRNLTLDNLLLSKGLLRITITDFQYSKRILAEDTLHTLCGAYDYMAPELLQINRAYDVPCDMWSVGVILFRMLSGCHPFRDETDTIQNGRRSLDRMLKRIRYGVFSFSSNNGWSGISMDAKDLVQRMMTVNPDERLRAIHALSHSWLYH